MSSSGMGDPDQQQTHTDFDSLFILDEADQQQLVAKQQIHRGQGSGASTPHRGSPARRNQVTGGRYSAKFSQSRHSVPECSIEGLK